MSVYDKDARKQIGELGEVIDENKALTLWAHACKTRWCKAAVWIHGDFASGNLLVRNERLAGVIDFGGMAVGDPACDLVIAWTYLHGRAREIFIEAMAFDDDTWLRAKAWCLWKATFELCEMRDKDSVEALVHKDIIGAILGE